MNVRALLLAAKREGLITAVKPLLDEMRNRGILMREGIYQETLRQAGELDNSPTNQNAS
jgi:predicted nucleic acid-binding protein